MTIGFIGSGNIGQAVAQVAIRLGYNVIMSNSRSPDTLGEVVPKLGSKAKAAYAKDVAGQSDVIVVCPPLFALPELPVANTAGKIIIDTMNYYPSRDGRIASLDNGRTTTSELTQKHFAKAFVVKAFNNIMAGQIPTDGLPQGAKGRRALPIAGNYPEANAEVAEFLETAGYDVLDVGKLSNSWQFENGTPAYVRRATLPELRKLLAAATRK